MQPNGVVRNIDLLIPEEGGRITSCGSRRSLSAVGTYWFELIGR